MNSSSAKESGNKLFFTLGHLAVLVLALVYKHLVWVFVDEVSTRLDLPEWHVVDERRASLYKTPIASSRYARLAAFFAAATAPSGHRRMRPANFRFEFALLMAASGDILATRGARCVLRASKQAQFARMADYAILAKFDKRICMLYTRRTLATCEPESLSSQQSIAQHGMA